MGLRLRRICNNEDDFRNQLTKLGEKLVERGYRQHSVSNALEKVLLVDRSEALKKKEKKKVNRIALPLPYDPRLPQVSSILYRFWKVLVTNPKMKSMFPSPPMVCWSRSQNIKDILVRAKLPSRDQPRRSERTKLGFKHCGRDCVMCSISPKFASDFRSSATKETFPICSSMTCTTSNVIYTITCSKQDNSCKDMVQYVGETCRRVCDRILEHRGSVTNPAQANTTKPVGQHFRQPGHAVSDMKVLPIEHVRSKDPWIRKVREKFYIKKLATLEPFGLNKKT